MAGSRRHHFIAQFYLRNFAEPLYSDNIQVYDRTTCRWERRTPRGVAWFPHLYAMFDERGERTDDFEAFLGEHVENAAAPALRHAAEFPDSLSQNHREAIALFIGVTAVRTPTMMDVTQEAYISSLPTRDLKDLDALVSLWCSITGQSFPDGDDARRKFLMPSLFGAILLWAYSMRDRLLNWKWTFIRSSSDRPFITSDWPVFAQHDEPAETRFVSFPISSEVALLVNSAGTVRQDRNPLEDVRAINRQTMDRASQFIVCRQQSFPGEECLAYESRPTPT
ncbi:MAG: DUF4238 domain-containing protein [Planctomycetes bacterium]|nr:DUF4238 domain-containing protein [Planctomycetota bacterium]